MTVRLTDAQAEHLALEAQKAGGTAEDLLPAAIIDLIEGRAAERISPASAGQQGRRERNRAIFLLYHFLHGAFQAARLTSFSPDGV